MRCLARFIVCLAVLFGPAGARLTSPLENSNPRTERAPLNTPLKSATPRSESILIITTPLDPQRTDPQRQIYMFDADEGYRSRGSFARAKHVLSYLRQMERVSKQFKRRDMVWYYQEAWEFAAAKIYGAMPPRADLPEILAHNPEKLPLPPAPPGPRPEMRRQPLRAIVKLITRPYRTWEITYEQLECGHEVLAPVGYSLPAKSRRCVACARAAMAQKKKPASAAAMAKAKAVGA